jgi:hypothetical protein
MDYVKIFTDVAMGTPVAGVLFYISRTIWNYYQKKDDSFTAFMKEQIAASVQNQKESNDALNNSADATRLLATALDKLRESHERNTEDVLREVRELGKTAKINGSRRPGKETKSATA